MSMNATEDSFVNLYTRKIMKIIAISMSIFHVITAARGALPTMQQRSIHLGFAIALIYAQSFLKEEKSKFKKLVCILILLLSTISSLYMFIVWEELAQRAAYPNIIDILMGIVLLVAVIDGTRRKLGIALPIMASIFILYAYFGNLLPKIIRHKGYGIDRIVGMLYMETEGIYSSIVGISGTYIFIFILFGAFLESSGVGKFFIDLVTGLMGKKRGGSAKISAISSGLFGMVSGSVVANVMAVGPLTVPMMTASGYNKRFAGAITSVAGTGGQLMPPIMGAAAFIMAESLGIPYIDVAKAAFIPAVIYYLAINFVINQRAERDNIAALKEVPDWKRILRKDFYLAMPLFALVYFLAVIRWSPLKSGFWSIVSLIAVASIKKATRMGFKKIIDSLEKGAYASLQVAIVCALAGVIIAMLSLTGLGLRISSILIKLSGGNMALLLFISMITGLILGMGLTTTSVYIILGVLVAPTLVQMGIAPIAAHLFMFYFGLLSAITPPVAVASYAAASVVDDNPMKVGFEAWKVGLSGYIIPYIFVYNNELLLLGKLQDIIFVTLTSLIAIYFLSIATEAYFLSEINLIFRAVLFISVVLLIPKGLLFNLLGLIIGGGILTIQYIKNKKKYKEI